MPFDDPWSVGAAPRSVLGVRGIESLTGNELYWLARVADAIGTDLDYLATVIGFETNHTFSPSVKNPSSGATGLIQFLPSTAKGLGTSVAELAAMSFSDQLAYVQRYLSNYAGSIHTLENLYLSIFFPAAIHMSDDAVIASEGSAVYEQNKGFDSEQTGQIRRADILRSIRAAYRSALDRPRVRVPDAPGERWGWALLVIATFAGLGAYAGVPRFRSRARRFSAKVMG